MGTFELRSNIFKNRLYIKLDGYFKEDETIEALDRFFLELDKLKPGFDLINDISGFKPLSPNSIEELRKAIQYTVGLGLKRAIRIVPVSYFAANQFSRVSKEIGFDVEFATSIEGAERMLDGKV